MSNNAIQKVSYEAAGQKVELTPLIVKQYLVSGGGNVSDQEVGMFLKICEGQKLNPFLREAYLVKYGNQPASIIVGKDAFTKRAESNPNYKGQKSGVIVINLKKDIEYREGTFYLKNREELVGGWAKVYFLNNKSEVFNTVSLDEYIGKKKDGSITNMWATKPGTMIKKVALVQALRDAFPNALGQMYISEEINNVEEEDLPTEPIDIKEEQRIAMHVEEPPAKATKLTKQQVMQLAQEKGLMTGTGKDADINKLNELCHENGINLKSMSEEQAVNLINILKDYQVVQDVPEEQIKQEGVQNEETEDSSEPF